MTWEEAIKQLDDKYYGIVCLTCDGYNVSFQKLAYRNQLRIFFYIDHVWKGEYLNANSEIGSKFGCPKYYRPSKKDIEFAMFMSKYKGKKFNAEQFKKEHTKILAYHPTHPSAASVIRTLKKTCKDVKLIEI